MGVNNCYLEYRAIGMGVEITNVRDEELIEKFISGYPKEHIIHISKEQYDKFKEPWKVSYGYDYLFRGGEYECI